jgi:hypothetical protein
MSFMRRLTAVSRANSYARLWFKAGAHIIGGTRTHQALGLDALRTAHAVGGSLADEPADGVSVDARALRLRKALWRAVVSRLAATRPRCELT